MSTGNLRWLTAGNGDDALSDGVTFGMPWPKGHHKPGQTFVIEAEGKDHPLDSRELALWPDGSLKWTAHSVSGGIPHIKNYIVKGAQTSADESGVVVDDTVSNLTVSNKAGLLLTFSRVGSSSFIDSLIVNGQTVCSGATIVASINRREYSTTIKKVKVENSTFTRAVVKVSGAVVGPGSLLSSGAEHLPFDVRIYVYSTTTSVKVLHSFIHDLDAEEPLTSLGLRFSVPLDKSELYNTHVRFGGSDGGILREAVQGLTGLRFGPTTQNKLDQIAGKAVTLKDNEWEQNELSTGVTRIPAFGDYSLQQLSSDGFTIKKRTKAPCSWVKITGGGRSDGTAYLGSARHGGLAVGMSDFWERYPTQLDLTGLTTDEGAATVWLYSPLAEPLETVPYHDEMGMDTFEKQIEGLNVTYEDYEPGFATANGIGRTNQLFLKPYLATPSNPELSSFSALVRNPPRLIPTSEYMHSTDVFHGTWAPDYRTSRRSPTQKESDIEKHLDFLFNYYHGQVEQHRWYGFWDHGDVQHTYDPYRHAWRYDVGGYAWDNSELSTDLWLWLYLLHTGRADVFKMAEAMTRHTSEVDVYHAGKFRGFGTRHGVQHFSDSSKQLRISNVLYKRYYYFLTGDERTGDLIAELQDCQEALFTLDSHRKVQQHADVPQGFAMTNIGLDCGALAVNWLTAWERRTEGWAHSRDLLVKMLNGLAGLQHGIGNNAILLNPKTGDIRSCPPPTPEYAISHLSMLFGFPEIFTELLHYAGDQYPSAVAGFKKVWLAYCRAYNGGPEVQKREFGFEFPHHATWHQSHSTLQAIAAVEMEDGDMATDAWQQFFTTDGYPETHKWTMLKASPPEYFYHGEEAPWVRTNEAAQFGIAAIFNLANIGGYLK